MDPINYFFHGRFPTKDKQHFLYLAGALMEHLLEGTFNEIYDWAHRRMYNIYLYIILVANSSIDV